MKKNLTTVMFRGTKAQEEQLNAVIEELRDVPGALMPILQKAQDIYGYLPVEVQKMIAIKLGISAEEVYGVSTFYSQFSLNPKGEIAIAVCLGTACYVKGSGKILEKLEEKLGIKNGDCTEDGEFSLAASRCIGACGLAPVFTINEDVYGRVKEDGSELDGILAKYKA